MSVTSIIATILNIAGSLCFLLYGMKLMSDGIQKSAGEKLKAALHFMTGNRFTALITGCLLTMIIQSSGATTVMVITFVNAGLITLEQSIPVIFGANIGTTITAWIVAVFGFNFKMEVFAIPIFGVGYLLTTIKKWHKEGFGQAIMGFGLLFIALGWLSAALSSNPYIEKMMPAIQNIGFMSIPVGFVIGIILTALMHSSSAMTAIVITMAYNVTTGENGQFIWMLSAAIVIGSNIGSTIDSILASFGANANAKRASLVHVLFNCFNALLALMLLKPFTTLVDFIVPGTVQSNIVIHIAMLHTLLKVIGNLLFLPWTKQIASVMLKLVKDDPSKLSDEYKLEFPESPMRNSPMTYIITAQNEVSHMADIGVQMFDRLQYGFTDRSGRFIADHYGNLVNEENFMDQMHEQLVNYLIKCEQLDVDNRQNDTINMLIQITSELESLSDDCLSIGVYIKRMNEKQYVYPQEDFNRLLPYLELVRQLLQFVYKNIDKNLTEPQMEFAKELEDSIDAERKALKKVARNRLEDGANVKAELLYMDLVRQIEKIGDRCFSIAGQLTMNRQ